MHNYKEYDLFYKIEKNMISPLAVRLRQKTSVRGSKLVKSSD